MFATKRPLIQPGADTTILVSGASGSLGLALCAMLRSKGYSVVGLGRSSTHKGMLESMGVRYIQADITQPPATLFTGQAFQVIVHCAALSAPWGPYDAFFKANVLGTRRMLQVASHHGSAFVHISTPSVYFDASNRLDICEDLPLPTRFASHYTSTKALAESLVHKATATGLRTVILRPRGLFGPHDTGIVPRVLRLARRGFFPVPEGGTTLVDITYVENVAHAICLCLEHMPEVQGECLNITNAQSLSVRDLLQRLFAHMQMKVRLVDVPLSVLKAAALVGEAASRLSFYSFEPPITRYTLGLLAYSQTLNIDKARTLLGYEPIYSIEQGLEQLSGGKACLS